MSLCKRRGGAGDREEEKVSTLWIAASNYSGSPSESAALTSFPCMCWNNPEDSCSFVLAFEYELYFSFILSVHYTKCTVKLKGLDLQDLMFSSCSQVCGQIFG